MKTFWWLLLIGYTAGLVKQPGVYAGPYTINVKISDLQGEFGVYNLSVTVCNCSVTPTCRTQRKTATKAASGAIGIVFASLLLLLCKKQAHCLFFFFFSDTVHCGIVTILVTHKLFLPHWQSYC